VAHFKSIDDLRGDITLDQRCHAAGLALSRPAVRFVQHMLFGVRATDPATFAVMAGILLAVTAAASLIPATRILWIDPGRMLGDE
jgi:putative ABC transport system permease protein